MTIPEALREARRLIAGYIEPAKTERGSRAPGHTMTAFADEFLDRQARHWKPRTLESNARIVRKDILPAFGNLTVDAITVEQVRDWFAAMSDRHGIANRAMPVLSMMMRMAGLWEYRAHNSNPCRYTKRYRAKPVDRFLTADEMARLGSALDANETRWPEAVAAIRTLALTGCRRSEVLDLRWRNVGEDTLNLEDSKSGPRGRMSPRRPARASWTGFCFPQHAKCRGEWSLTNCWRTACADAGLGRLRLHNLRNTAASQAVMADKNLPQVGKHGTGEQNVRIRPVSVGFHRHRDKPLSRLL
ncbi:MAG: site-specific integrase, partial [Paracoccaceae bacterium]|nr:site-specific integrase [Paracoccaceae bacterium]